MLSFFVVDGITAVVLCHSVSNVILHLCNVGFVWMPQVELETVKDVLVNGHCGFLQQAFICSCLIFQIFDEADLDDDNQLSFAEFEHVISKAPDFVK